MRNRLLWVFFSVFLLLHTSTSTAQADDGSEEERYEDAETVSDISDEQQQVVPEQEVMSTIEDARRRMEETLSEGSTEGSLSPLVQATINDLSTDLNRLQDSLKSLEELYVEYSNMYKETTSLIREANSKQLENFVDRLEETLEKESGLRTRKEYVLTQIEEQNEVVVDDDGNDNEDDDDDDNFLEPEVTMEMLEERLDIKSILEESEREISSWILQVAKEELDKFKKNKLADAQHVKGGQATTTTTTNAASSAANKIMNEGGTMGGGNVCPTTNQILEQVQQRLNRYHDDGIGLIDYASRGAKIVHMMTSETYIPPSQQTLGTVWWNKFIPEDWENLLLPAGWKDWNVGIPDYVYHSLGLSGATVSLPETVLQPKVLPGSCWPMSGSRGQITMKLDSPIVIESLTVDHVSWAIVPKGKHMSAPKKVVVVAYPPCDVGDEACGSVGFDINQEFEVARIDYNAEGGDSVQTFDSHYGQAMKNHAANSKVEEDVDEGDGDNRGDVLGEGGDDPASCSTNTAASCSVPPRIPAAAVTFRVLENWGEPDFTCIYRLRVHASDES